MGMNTPAKQVRNPAFETEVYLTPKVIKVKMENSIVPKRAEYFRVMRSMFLSFR